MSELPTSKKSITSDGASEVTSLERAPLRWWPAAILFVAMLVLRAPLAIVDSPSLNMLLTAFFGSGIVVLFIFLWWLFASRAGVREKVLVLAGYIFIATVGIALLHPTMQGLVSMLFVVPAVTTIFAASLVATAHRPKVRIPTALIATSLGFLFFSLLQVEGFDAKFRGNFLWRWNSSSEDRFLAELSDRNAAPRLDTQETPPIENSEWPGFRGADRSGVVRGVVLADDWNASPPKELWRTKMGPGWSSFAVAGNRLFTQEQRGDNEAVVCLDADTGAVVWEYVYPGRFWESIGGAGPRGTPTLAPQGVFTLGGDGKLLRLDPSTGKMIWQRDLKADSGRQPPTWGFASSPLVIQSRVIVFAGGDHGKGVLAYDVESGEPAWSTASGVHSYSSPQLATLSDEQGVLMLTDHGVQFLSIQDGSVLWHYDWKQEDYRVVQPLVMDNSILVGASLATGASLIHVARTEKDWTIHEDWKTRNLKPDFNDSVVYQGYVYGFDSGIFCCVDLKNGSRAWKKGRYGNGQVILLDEAGQLLVLSEKGELVLINASPEKLIEVSKYQALEGKTWNHPVLIQDRLYVRNAEEAACFQMTLK